MHPQSRFHHRPLSTADYDEIYRWSTDSRTSQLWRYRGATPPPDTVVRQLWDGVTLQYCIADRTSHRPIGIAGIYNANTVSGYAYAYALAAPEFLNTGLVTRGALEVIDLAFQRFRFRKIYLESVGSSFQMFSSGTRFGVLQEEGRLNDHERNGHGFDDLIFLSISAERWSAYRQRIGLK